MMLKILGIVFAIAVIGVAAIIAKFYVSGLEYNFKKTKHELNQRSIEKSEFVVIGGILHGITIDQNIKVMYVAQNGKTILKVLPNGEYSEFVELPTATGKYQDGPGHTFIYDLAQDSAGNIYAAAEDRLVKISRDGLVSEVVQKNFPGRWGLCGVIVLKDFTVLASYSNQIIRINSDGETTTLFDGEASSPALSNIVGLATNEQENVLYAAVGDKGETGQLIKIPLTGDDLKSKFETVISVSGFRPEYMAWSQSGSLFVAGPENSSLLAIDTNDEVEVVDFNTSGFEKLTGPVIATIQFGGEAFNGNTLYAPSWFGKIYKFEFSGDSN